MQITSEQIQRINKLVIDAKTGNTQATHELRIMFRPLIQKISKQIHNLYGGYYTYPDIIEQANHIFICITVLEYDTNGPAHYPYFVKKYLHARLVQFFRPDYCRLIRNVPLDHTNEIANKEKEASITEEERKEIVNVLHEYIKAKCNKREKDIVYKCILSNVARNDIAYKYHISNMRMQQIHNRLMEKMRILLLKMGVHSINEI